MEDAGEGADLHLTGALHPVGTVPLGPHDTMLSALLGLTSPDPWLMERERMPPVEGSRLQDGGGAENRSLNLKNVIEQ